MLNTLLIGFGGIAQGLAEDKIYGENIEYATHAQVLKTHSSIRWDWLVEPNKSLQQIAINKWKIKQLAKFKLINKHSNSLIMILMFPLLVLLSIIELMLNSLMRWFR